MKKAKRALLWFRQDLRLHDNEALQDALDHADEILPVYIFDERVFKGQTHWFGFPKTGKYRAKFILESVADLRQSLRAKGSDLLVRVGKPEEIIFELCQQIKSNWVFCNRERTQEELDVQNALERKLWTIGQEIRFSRGKMLYYTADLPFPVTHTPDIFTHFRKEVERYVPIREPLQAPEKISYLDPELPVGDMPTLADFGHDDFEVDDRGVLDFKGGETAGLARLKQYFWDTDAIKTYKQTRNELLGANYSSKFSVWLAQGCLSPKQIYHELKKYEAERGANKDTYWLFFELLWRDFFRFMGKKHENTIFFKEGPKGEMETSKWRNDWKLFNKWQEGKTGIPFIDANMREIAKTGFMSNRGRQNVASFLVKDLYVNWQMGAEYFESILIDYDVTSNWGNWNYVAGVGSDPRENRYFNILTQANRYDEEGEYVKHWLPELANLPQDKIHRPDLLTKEEQDKYGVHLGGNYPKAMVPISKWAKNKGGAKNRSGKGQRRRPHWA